VEPVLVRGELLQNREENSAVDKWTSGAAYEVWMGRWSRLLAHEFLQWLSIPAQGCWLDVCCGSGVVSRAIAETCSPASVAGLDASPGQIGFAREQNTPGLTFTVADALTLPFDDESFDASICCLGLNFIPQPDQALREMRRVTRSGGTVAVYVWDYAQGARFLREFWDAASAVDPEAASFDQAVRFPLCAPDPLREIFESVKLEQVALTALNVVTRFASFDDYWQPFSSGQGGAPNYLATRNDHTRSAIRERLRTSLPSDADGAIALPARAWAVRGQRP